MRLRFAVIREFYLNEILNHRIGSKDVCFLALLQDAQNGHFWFYFKTNVDMVQQTEAILSLLALKA